MKRFAVTLHATGRFLIGPVWSFWINPTPHLEGLTFPPAFTAFDAEPDTELRVVYVADSTPALVAYDWLLEDGWTLDTDTTDPDRVAFLTLLNGQPDR